MNNSQEMPLSLKLKKDTLRVIETRESKHVNGGIIVKPVSSDAWIATKCTC